MAVRKSTDLFAFDLDGTLVHRKPSGEKHIPQELLDVVHSLSKRHHMVVATGRRYRATLEDLKLLPPMDFVIAHNGLVIRDTYGNLQHRQTIDPLQALAIARLISHHREDFFIVADGYDSQTDYIFTQSALDKYKSIQMVHERGPQHCHILNSIEDLKSLSDLPLLEVAAIGDPMALSELKTRLNPVLPAGIRGFVVKNIGVLGFGALEIFSQDLSKWTGIEWVKKILKAERVIAVGDDENDIEMLKYADIGVAMGHAEPHVLEAAKHRTQGPLELSLWLRNFDR